MPDPRPTLDPNADEASIAGEQRISADSHMAEPPDLFETRLPKELRDRALHVPEQKLYETNHHLRAGGWDPHERLKDLALDGVSAEVLYPTYAKQAWLMGDPLLEEAHIRVYNDWLIEFCAVAPERFWGLAMISFWDIEGAVHELERCAKAGMHGATIPIGPDSSMPLSSEHYEPFWAAAESLGMPINLHINTGPTALRGPQRPPRIGLLPDQVHKMDCQRALGDLIGAGVLERHPGLNFVIAEVSAGSPSSLRSSITTSSPTTLGGVTPYLGRPASTYSTASRSTACLSATASVGTCSPSTGRTRSCGPPTTPIPRAPSQHRG